MKLVMVKASKVSIIATLSSVILFTIIALTIRTCSSEGDASVAYNQHPTVSIDTAFQSRIDSFVTHVPHVGTLGMMVYDATAQRVVYSYNADAMMSPASCMKLLTCITALRKFGKSVVHRTRLYTSGTMHGDTLVGNVTLKTQFDPLFIRDSLYVLTDALGEKGIHHLRGKVVLDMADYLPMQHEEHWTPGDLRVQYLGLPFLGGYRLRREMLYALARLGIAVQQKNIVFGRLNYNESKLLSEMRTPMHSSIEKAMKNSSNINAEALLYPLGYTVSNKGHFRENGVKVLRAFISQELKMNPSSCAVIEDGCGLCPNDKLTARLLVTLLNYAYQHKYIFEEIYTTLPLSGIDGTLHDRMTKPHVREKIKAKTGTLTREEGISSLAGYCKSDDGHTIIFAIINNACPVMDGRWWQDKLWHSVLPR